MLACLALPCMPNSATAQHVSGDMRGGSSSYSSTAARDVILPKIVSNNPPRADLPSSPGGVPTVQAETSTGLPLLRRAEAQRSTSRDRFSGHADMLRIGSSLGIVLALFLGFVWVLRRFRHQAPGEPNEVFQVLGEFPLMRNQRAYVVRFASRILVLADTARGVEKITELTDALEVEQVTSLCANHARPAGKLDPYATRQLRDAVAREPRTYASTQQFA